MAEPALPARGQFGHQAVVGPFEPRLADTAPTSTYFGLARYATALYGTFRDADGTLFNAQRMIEVEMTGGLALSSNIGGGTQAFHPRSRQARLGMIVEYTTDTEHVVESIPGGMTGLPDEPGAISSEPLQVIQRVDSAEWSEGDVMSVTGSLVGCGLQWHLPDRAGAVYFAAHPYRASGVILGCPVEGFLWYDQIYLPPGMTFFASPFFGGIEVLAMIWGNDFGAGRVEVGQIFLGTGGCALSVAADQDGPLRCTTNAGAVIARDAGAYPSSITFDVHGAKWEWSADANGQLPFGGDYRGVEGRLRREGDGREPEVWMGYIESFASRSLTG